MRAGLDSRKLAALAFAAAIAVGGCDVLSPSTAPTSPPVAATPTPSPVGELLAAKLADPAFQFEATQTATMTYVARKDGASTVTTWSGTIDYNAGDFAMKTEMKAAGKTVTTESVVSNGTGYQRQNGGKWTKLAKLPPKAEYLGPANLLLLKRSLAEVGVETRFTEKLHKVAFADNEYIEADLVRAMTSKSISNPGVKAFFWARDDGSPAGLTLEGLFTDAVNGVASNVTLTWDVMITKTSGVDIAAPKI